MNLQVGNIMTDLFWELKTPPLPVFQVNNAPAYLPKNMIGFVCVFVCVGSCFIIMLCIIWSRDFQPSYITITYSHVFIL